VKYNQGKEPYAEERFLRKPAALWRARRRLADAELVADTIPSPISPLAVGLALRMAKRRFKEYPNVRRWYTEHRQAARGQQG